jgi:hypothetical protein
MPRVAMDFSKTVIYHFVCQDANIKCSYVGSTTNIVKRKYQHKSLCHKEGHKDYNLKLYKNIRDNGGWDNWKMVPLEEHPCENYTQQVIREQYWIDKLKPEMNCIKAYQPDDVRIYKQKWNEENRERLTVHKKNYYDANREKFIEKQKTYRIENLVKIKEYQKEYNEKNHEGVVEYHKKYKEENREKLSEKAKEYYDENREKFIEKQKAYREANRDKINEKQRVKRAKKP